MDESRLIRSEGSGPVRVEAARAAGSTVRTIAAGAASIEAFRRA